MADTASGNKGLTRKAAEGLVLLLGGSGAKTGLTIAAVAVLARLLDPADFGLIAAANIVVGLTDTLAFFGVGAALIQCESIQQDHVGTGFSICVVSGLAASCLVYAASPVIAGLLHMAQLKPVLRALCILFPVNAVSSISASILRREFRYRSLAGADLFSYLLGYGGIGISLACLGFGVWALVGAMLGFAGLRAAVMYALQPYSFALKMDRGCFRKLTSYGSGFTIGSIFHFAASSGDNLIVGRFLGAAALGIYSRAYSMMDMSNSVLGNVLNSVFFPAVARVQNEQERLAKALQRAVALAGAVFLPACAASIVLAPEVVSVLLGPKWTGVVLPFRLLAAGMYFRLGSIVAELLAQGSGKIYSIAWRQGVYALLVVAGALAGCRWGVAGVALCISGAIILNFAAMVELALRITGTALNRLYREGFQHCILTAVIGLEAYGVASACRELGLPAALTLLLTSLAVLAVFFGLLRFKSGFILGKDGGWVLEGVGRYFPVRWFFSMPLEEGKDCDG